MKRRTEHPGSVGPYQKVQDTCNRNIKRRRKKEAEEIFEVIMAEYVFSKINDRH